MALNLNKGEIIFPPRYAENSADSQRVTIRENDWESNENQDSLTDPLLQEPIEIKNREKVTSKGFSVTMQLNNIAKQVDITMQLSMLCIFGNSRDWLITKDIDFSSSANVFKFQNFALFSYIVLSVLHLDS